MNRRGFLAAGLALPAAGFGQASQDSRANQAQASGENTKLVHRKLGNTGLNVTSLSFGCMTTSDASVIEHAADVGIVHFDTARSYQNGNNERMVGAALKSRRPRVIISSKSGAKTKEAALAELDTSLHELGTDYLDIWYLHVKNDPADVTDDLLEAQRIAKKSGKIRFAGVSTHFNMDRMLTYLAKLGQTDVVLTTYNFAMRSVASDRNTDTTRAKNRHDSSDPSGAQIGHGHRRDESAGGRSESHPAWRPAVRREFQSPIAAAQPRRYRAGCD